MDINENPKVMIIDDEKHILNMLKMFFRSKEISVVTFSSPLDAIDKLESMSLPEVQLILLDVNMPDINGLEMLKKLKDVVPEIQVIMITGQTDMELARECLKIGAKDYISKPFDFDYLETSVLMELLI